MPDWQRSYGSVNMRLAWRKKEHAQGESPMSKPGFLRTATANVLLWLSALGAANSAPSAASGKAEPAVRPALAAGSLGLFPVADFRLVPGTCADCATPKEALWYFQDDLVAVPLPGAKIAGFAGGVPAQEDVRRWYAVAGPEELQARPPLVGFGGAGLTPVSLSPPFSQTACPPLRASWPRPSPSSRSSASASTCWRSGWRATSCSAGRLCAA